MTLQEKYMEDSRHMETLLAAQELVLKSFRTKPDIMTASAGWVLAQMMFDQMYSLDSALDAVAQEAADRLCDVG